MNTTGSPSESRSLLPSDKGEARLASPATSARPPTGARVLVIDDEPEIWRAVRAGLISAGFTAEWASTAAEGIDLSARWHPDVLILDLSLPDQDGLDVCRQVRTWSQVPIIVLSVRGKDEDKVTALELGADDYLTKPFSMAELLARIRVALRHAAYPSTRGDQARFETGGLVIDFERRQVTVEGRDVHLTPTEYDLLKYLAHNAGKVLTHRAILQAIWGPAYEQETSYLRVFFNQLRRKIEPDPSRPRYLLTELGIGYRLRETE
ncbi:MAG TPA: response regulator transcription factor [Ktedonobacterales bacterium]|jgi:two-component system KDP operon response regulator KdpE